MGGDNDVEEEEAEGIDHGWEEACGLSAAQDRRCDGRGEVRIGRGGGERGKTNDGCLHAWQWRDRALLAQ